MTTEATRAYAYCLYCGTPAIQWHHSILRSQGGDDIDNLVPLCPSCHERRHQEQLRITRSGDVVTFTEVNTGEITERQMVGQVSTCPSKLVDQARSVITWIQTMAFSGALRTETDEHLATLYQELRSIKHFTWRSQAAIIDEMQSRSSYGDECAKHVAEALGCGERTVQSRGQIYREILSDPACSQAIEIIPEEAFYREAVATEDPVHWINYACEKKIANPKYTTAQFRQEIRTPGQESSLIRIVMVCRESNDVDEEIANGLQMKYGVPVEVMLEESIVQVSQRSLVGISG